ncbi:MAG: hypothetical protein ACHQHL_10035 [Steroidobacterales bacterium]
MNQGADLANLCNEAALAAARENRKQIGMSKAEAAPKPERQAKARSSVG